MRLRLLCFLPVGVLVLALSAGAATILVIEEGSEIDGVLIASEMTGVETKAEAPAALSGADIAAAIAGEFLSATPPASQAGVALAQDLAEPDALFTGRFRTELELLKRLTLLSRIDLWANVNPRADRAQAVRELENRFEDTLGAAKAVRQRLVDEGNAVDDEVDALEAKVDQTDAAFFQALDQYQAETASDRYAEFIDQKQRLVYLRAEFGQYSSLNSRFRELIPQVEQKLQALQENREALIAGVQVDRETAVRAGVVKNGE